MTELAVACPRCGESFELTEALAAPLLEGERKKAEAEFSCRLAAERAGIAKQAAAATEAAFAAKLKAAETLVADKDAKLRQAQEAELALRCEREQLEQAKRELELTVQRRVDEERNAAAKEASEATEARLGGRLKAAEALIIETDAKLKAAEDAELSALTLKREAEEGKRQAELTVARRLDEERVKVRDAAIRERDAEHRLKLSEKDKQLAELRQQIEELRRTGTSVSQQLAGEVLELDLCALLGKTFPSDGFDRVKKGQSGGDVVQTVRGSSGQAYGKILWESKRTKCWSEGWLAKLRDDQRAVNADLAALATETLPEGVQHFDVIDGVWVTGLPTVIPMATALRKGLIETALARRAAAGADTKKDLVYGYLVGNGFRQRVRALLEPMLEMREDLDREKRLITKQWSAREKQLERTACNLAGLYGDLQGIVGSSLPAVDGLVLPQLQESTEQHKLAVVNASAAASNHE